jgi:hypothetical protein
MTTNEPRQVDRAFFEEVQTLIAPIIDYSKRIEANLNSDLKEIERIRYWAETAFDRVKEVLAAFKGD